MLIRKAIKEDVPTIVKWTKKTPELQIYAGDHLGKEYYKKMINEGFCLVFEMEKKIVGFLIAELDKDIGFSYLNELLILPDYRGMGIGKKLMKAYIDECKKNKVEKVYIFAQTDNEKATKFYEHNGFKKGKKYYAMYKEFK